MRLRTYWFFFLGIVFLLGIISNTGCNTEGDGDGNGNGNGNGDGEDTTYQLTVQVGTGVEGAPAPGTYTYDENQSVSYSYQLRSGYTDLTVTLDGTTVSAEGSITMDQAHHLAATATAAISSQAEYFVSPNGNDNNDGQSSNSAFRTLQKALNTVLPGQTILILPGTYNESITLENIGSPVGAITIKGETNPTTASGSVASGTAILDGQNSSLYSLWCENCENLVFENLEIRNYTDMGIGTYLCSNIIYRNLKVYNNGFAVQLRDWELEGYGIQVDVCTNVIVEGCEAFRNGPNPQLDILMGTGINTYGCRDLIIRNNYSYENTGGGFLVEDGINVVFENNTASDNDCDASVEEWWDAGLWVDGGYNVIIRNNTFTGNLGAGIEISDEDFQSPYGYVLENNTSTGNYFGIYVWNFGTTDWPPETILQRSGNIFSGNTRQDVWIQE